ncbi:hypothetical protein LTR09_002693 [Extremus antarcticus]|uniref:DUF2293 domain-containing protein n=1 Tax=Extremus antarcticus TaxID=702011 RepID=A0AAJ0GEV8_9PEZI|nr:hypothetical protein LTR09_002693 [Extremus antarcticus]
MTNTQHHTIRSRATASRPASAARSVLQKRDKPYRTEQTQVLMAKKKLQVKVTALGTPPRGYTFVPSGTPPLSDLCKEMSRLNNYVVYHVNAPTRHWNNPEKVATHLSRIGYYFNSQLVAQACDKLGYIPYKKAFIKEADLAVQSRMARTMADYGVVGEIQAVEDDSQVRAAMKELFPMMPQHDVEAIIQHAWHGDGSTVGNNMTLSLSRRIQLATGARIRHTYTDYDRLLRAFGTWQEVRAIVEPDCLEKIKEWRGENDEEEKEENEWIWHDIIVIEDEEDEANKMKMKDDDNNNQNTHMHDADDSDSVVILDDSSEASFDTTDRQARGADMNMETEDEAFTRGRMDRRIRRPQSQESNEAYLYGFTNGCKGRRISDEAAPPPLLAYPQPMAPQQPLRWQHQQPQAGGGVGYGQYQPYHAGAVLPRREEAQATTARDMVIGGRVYQRMDTQRDPRYFVPRYEDAIPSIEPAAAFSTAPPQAPPLQSQRAVVIDLTTPERQPAPRQPVHGALAPVQQLPRRPR